MRETEGREEVAALWRARARARARANTTVDLATTRPTGAPDAAIARIQGTAIAATAVTIRVAAVMVIVIVGMNAEGETREGREEMDGAKRSAEGPTRDAGTGESKTTEMAMVSAVAAAAAIETEVLIGALALDIATGAMDCQSDGREVAAASHHAMIVVENPAEGIPAAEMWIPPVGTRGTGGMMWKGIETSKRRELD